MEWYTETLTYVDIFVKRHFVIQVLIYQYNTVRYTNNPTNERLKCMFKIKLHLFEIILIVPSNFLFKVVSIGIGQLLSVSFQF